LLHAIYIIHQLSGVCVVYAKYGTIEFNEDLIAGFLMALKDFSHEVTGGKGHIKILDMIIFNIHLVFRGGVLVAAASDKKDSKEIAQNKIELILSEFLKRYGATFESWNGDVRQFKDFNDYLDITLLKGKVAEVPRVLPLLKLFEKDYKNETKVLDKNTKLDEKVLDSSSKVRDWKQKKLPRQILSQGLITQQEYDFAHHCDGFKDISEISEESGVTVESAQLIIEKLSKLDLIKLVKV
jgi:hypothetical protein